jgi:purine-binding chemotaxis protein CheW
MKHGARPAVDWQKVKRRLAATERALARGSELEPAQRRAILRARAEALAATQPPAMPPGMGFEVVEFALGARRFAIEAAFVREVQPLEELTGVPCTPPFVSGIINAHGRILAVIDLQRFLELPESGLSDQNKVIILQQGDLEFGILADRIAGTRGLLLADLQPPSPALVGRRAHCLRGVTSQQLLVLDAQRLAGEPSLVVDEEVAP